jgi:hypothetical protein
MPLLLGLVASLSAAQSHASLLSCRRCPQPRVHFALTLKCCLSAVLPSLKGDGRQRQEESCTIAATQRPRPITAMQPRLRSWEG